MRTRTKLVRNSVSALALLALGVSASGLAAAQEAGEEEITVTARKKSESLQKAPVTVTAVGGAELDRFQYTKVEDIAARIPTLNVETGGSGSGAQVSLRGVGSSNISAAFDSAVALDFDGVSVSNMRLLQSSFFDVAQIEVLKGPQSLFFGKSASAGVLSFKSRNPTPEWESGVSAGYEFEQQGVTVEAYTSGPITDTLGVRIAAQFHDISKVIRNTAPIAGDPDLSRQDINVRGTLQWDPSENFNANLKLNYVRYEADNTLDSADIDCGPNGVADPISLFGGTLLIPAGYDCDPRGKTVFQPDTAPALRRPLNKDQELVSPFVENETFFARLNMVYDLTPTLSLTSVTGYVDFDARVAGVYSYAGAIGGVSFGAGLGVDHQTLEQYTQELRIASDYSGPFNFMLGGFYEHRDMLFDATQHAANIGLVAPDPVTGRTSDYEKLHPTEAEAYSIFGSVTYDITEKLQLTAGVRWSREEKTNHIIVPYVHAFLAASPAFIDSGFDSGPIDFSDENTSPEVSLRYEVNDDVTLYAAYKTGFKSGGIDNSALPTSNLLGFDSPDPAVRQAVVDKLVFKSETAEGFEAGVKSRLLGRKLTLNASVFRYVFTDLQVQNFNAFQIQFVTSNAGELTTQGVDVDFNWITDTPGLSIYGSLAYTDAEYSAPFVPDPLNAPLENLEGRAPAGAPEWAGNIAIDYRRPVSETLELGLTANMRFFGDYYTNQDTRFRDFIQEGDVSFDLAASIGTIDTGWEISLVGSNLGNKRFVTTSGLRPFLSPTGDDTIHTLEQGRKVTLQAGYRF